MFGWRTSSVIAEWRVELAAWTLEVLNFSDTKVVHNIDLNFRAFVTVS